MTASICMIGTMLKIASISRFLNMDIRPVKYDSSSLRAISNMTLTIAYSSITLKYTSSRLCSCRAISRMPMPAFARALLTAGAMASRSP